MLETKDLCKTYTPKKGVPVTAIDHISLRFPEKGMVFLLGKSGSGKSTMLNLLGGLDQYDSGEIIIKGISSKDFDQQRFDSYRNTYVGFIFQEYNVLEEFTVGANIALALELQGKSAADEELNRILKMVDLDGFGSRKPNELSGGQKQRVAIARALVKNPEIIMADEPTGALDSATGRQVLDTLKKLSAEKLVIIVSHDREYAEQYADRIIEMADGKVIRDVEAVRNADGAEKKLVFRQTSIEIPAEYHLTEEDRAQINAYLDQLRSGASLMLPASAQQFRDTDTSVIPVQDGSDFKLIKSKLPMKSAFRIGSSSLKHKKFRLVMTILLSCAAFTLFSLVDTFSSYDHVRTCTDSLIDSDVGYISMNRAERMGKGVNSWWNTDGIKISEEQLKAVEEETGIQMTGIFIPNGADLSFDSQYGAEYEFSKGPYSAYFSHFCGFSEITEQTLQDQQFKLVGGKLPDGSKNEIAISAVLADTFVKAGYLPPKASASAKPQKITSPVAMLGKVIRLMGVDYTVTAVLDTDFDLSRYERLANVSFNEDVADELVNHMLNREFNISSNYSLSGCAMVGPGKVQEMIAANPNIYTTGMANIGVNLETKANYYAGFNAQYVTTLDRIPADQIIWLDGEKKTLEQNDIIINFEDLYMDGEKLPEVTEDLFRDLRDGKKEATAENLNAMFEKLNGNWQLHYGKWDAETDNYQHEEHPAQIVGFVKPKSAYAPAAVVSDYYADKLIADREGVYDSIVGAMPEDRSGVNGIVRYCYRDGDSVAERYQINHAVVFELDTVNEGLHMVARVFLYLGIGFAVFAALLMANFITTSIHYKRQEIGILRAIGSRSADVFRIFFSESFVIAMINFVISSALTALGVVVINYFVRREFGILITVLHFGARQVILLALLSIAIAAVSSFLPVYRIASKRPIDAIRDK